jgi:peptidyl-prolyl cis-trans isomerase D
MLRKSAGSWLAKGLFGLLILSFGIWGIGDVVRGGGSGDAAITVGEVEVSPYTVRREFDAKVNQMRQMLGDQMTVEFARQAGVMQATVSELIGTATLDMTARDLGVTVSDDGIRQELTQTPAFRDQSGAFNSNQFKAVLAQNGYTEARYVSELRSGLTRARLVNALVGGVAVPSAMSDTLYRYTQEKRTAESLTIHPEALTVDASPTDADLQAIYDAASTDFMAPEYRTIVAVMLSSQPRQLHPSRKTRPEPSRHQRPSGRRGRCCRGCCGHPAERRCGASRCPSSDRDGRTDPRRPARRDGRPDLCLARRSHQRSPAEPARLARL